jgi:hypothetical protein
MFSLNLASHTNRVRISVAQFVQSDLQFVPLDVFSQWHDLVIDKQTEASLNVVPRRRWSDECFVLSAVFTSGINDYKRGCARSVDAAEQFALWRAECSKTELHLWQAPIP